ncbi:MAG: 4-hydroxyproline epimerase [Planctomycetota bacterium]
MARLDVIDSHTGGEPTRLVINGGPDLGQGSVAAKLEVLRRHHDGIRRACVNEPRGSEAIVGGLLCEPQTPDAAAGVIYFNNVGYLHMCGHGTIGLAVTLAHLGRIQPGHHTIDTAVGRVGIRLHEDGHTVGIQNVPSYRYRKQVPLDVPGLGTIHGDIAWGGNWFFLVSDHRQSLSAENIKPLTDVGWRIRRALEQEGITGEDGGEIDHIELFGPPIDPNLADAQNFVLCPGGAYDRSPCGTGTSAKIACLAADGQLAPGETWRQQSIIGSVFEAAYSRLDHDRIQPTITGSAYINAQSTFLIDPDDPFAWGI